MKRSSGVLMHVSSLWGDHSCGCFGNSAKQWVDFLCAAGFTYWQVLPFCVPDEYNSPYKSYSTFSIHPYFIDLEQRAKQGLLTCDEIRECKQDSPYRCEFERLGKERMPLLFIAASRFLAKAQSVNRLDEFFKEYSQTESFCRFMALKEANGGAQWNQWTVTKYDTEVYNCWRFIQYVAITQWQEIKAYANQRGVRIIGDIPMYVAYDSSDVWADPTMFRLDKRNLPSGIAGVPPDYFSADGQVWGNPLYDWKRMKQDGYAWWKERMGFMLKLFDGVRIDHFRALEAFFCIPYGDSNAHRGKWIKGPGMDFIRELKSVCGDALIIAEDLGDITDKVRKLVNDSGYPGMRVLQFGFLSDDNNSDHVPHRYSQNCVAYTGTHDNNTLLGYVWELDESARNRFVDYFGHPRNDWDNCYGTVIRSMLATSADTVIFPVQDLLRFGADTRLNTPGSCGDNWSFRITRQQFESLDAEHYSYLNRLYGRKQ